MLSTILLFVGIGLFGWAFYKWATKNKDYFNVTNKLPHIKPTFLLGTTGALLLKKYRTDDFVRMLYESFPTAR